uniref:RCC1 domain-containing protein n=1 Tax=Facilibium subflavum TaxID=2219058 RepID=UPI001AACA541
GDVIIKADAFDTEGIKIGERDLKIVNINITASDDLRLVCLLTESLTLRPGTLSQMVFNHTKGLNNAYLDLNQMPLDVYNELTQIQVTAENKSLTFDQAQLGQYYETKIIPLGYLPASASETEISLSFEVTAGNALEANKVSLESLSTPPIQFGAANSLPVAPSINVYTTVLDAQPVEVDSPSVETITFNNTSNYPVLIENLIADNLPKGTTLKDVGTCIQGSNISVGGSCQAKVEITEAAEGEGELILEYTIQELLSQVSTSELLKLNTQDAILRISSKVNVSKVGGSIEIPGIMNIPLPQSAEGTKNKYLVTLGNTGNFNLNALSGSTIADNVALFDQDGNLYGDAKVELHKIDEEITQTCDVGVLTAHSSCQMVIAVDRDAQKANGLNLKFKSVDLFSNLDATKVDVSSATANVVNEDPSISLFEYGSSTPIASTLSLEQLDEDNLRIVVQNVGGSNLIFGTNSVSINNTILNNKPIIINNTCNDATLIPQQSCEFYIQGKTASFNTVSENLLIKIASADALVESSFSLNYLAERIKKLRTGRWHGCYLTTKGDVYCWGRNEMGDLGRGFDSDYQTAPAKIKMDGALAGKTVDKISARNQHACIIDTQGEIYCWGANSSGELANTPYGYNEHISVPTQIQKGSLPVNLSFQQVDIGSSHTCAIGSDDAAYCWGRSSNYRLGFQPTVDSYSTPVAVSMSANGFVNTNLYDIATGIGAHTCAIDQNNKLYCWGYNHRKQLGADGSGFYNTVYLSESPIVPLFPITDSKVTKVVNNYRNTCALTLQNNVYCWGSNEDGMLGINDSNYSQYNLKSIPQKVVMPSNVGAEILDLDMADGTACFVDSNYDVYCWGANIYGTIAQSADVSSIYPKPTKINLPNGISDIDFDQVSVGQYFACASEKMTTNVYCWGSNAFGQIGSGIAVGSSSYTAIPTLVK